MARLVKDKSTDALRRTLEKEHEGGINVVGSTGNQIAVARKRQHGPDTIITIVTAGTMSFRLQRWLADSVIQTAVLLSRAER